MKKVWIGVLLAGVLVAAFAAVGAVSAQTTAPQGDASFGLGRRGMMANSQGFAGTGEGLLHDYMVETFADQLGVSVDEINERLASGERVVDIALEKGLTVEEFRALMVDARAQALDQALADGVITQEQADWMKTRGAGMSGARGGMRGGMRGGYGGNYAGCPMLTQPAQ
jgi:hypothetical protein